MSYHDENPVIPFRIKKETKRLIKQIADENGLSVNVLCRKIIEAYLRQKDMFEIVYKKEE